MIIKELSLQGFGKFENKSLLFKEGINIIYGENESGKTTIHNFIEGMFYGFLKPYVKSTRYNEEQEKYKPWTSNRYSGIIIFSHMNNLYRIEREFSKENANTRVLVENTGEDITFQIDNGENGRVLQPGYQFFGFNNVVYSNTVSIRQLGTKTDGSLASELRDKLANITTSFNEEISVENAIKNLNNRIKDIGTLKAPTSIYAKINNKLNQLIEEEEEILTLKESYINLLDESKNIANKIILLERKYNDEKLKLIKIEYKEKENIYLESISLNGEINSIEIKLKSLEIYKDYLEEDYNNLFIFQNEIKIIESKLENCNNIINELNKNNITKFNSVEHVEKKKREGEARKDYLKYESLEEDKNKYIYSENNSIIELLRRDLEHAKKDKNKLIIWNILLGLLYFGITYYALKNNYSIMIPQALLGAVAILIFNIRKLNIKLKGIENKISEANILRSNKENNIMVIENQQKYILNQYNVTSKFELRNIVENLQRESFKMEQDFKYQEENVGKINLEVNKVTNLNIEKNNLQEKINKILLKYNKNNISEIYEGLIKRKEYDELKLEINNKREILSRILGNYTINNLKFDLDSNKELDYADISLEDLKIKNILKNKVEELNEQLTGERINKRGIEENISHINPRIVKLVEIREEIIKLKAEISELDNKKDAIEFARDTIEELSKEIHTQFAPEINRQVGNIIDKITNGKYSGIRIDNNLNIGIIDPSIGDIVNIKSLSGGTIDQLYFSLRFGVINSIGQDNLPLILDDCFVQYDNNRLNNILSFLEEISLNRQIILFSCHKREINILDEKGIRYNLITLS